jgi:Zn ribbon nucleic-acid-binding protein
MSVPNFAGSFDSAKLARASLVWRYDGGNCPQCGKPALVGLYDGVPMRHACFECGWAKKQEQAPQAGETTP